VVYRQLATVRPARYRPELATAVYNLAEATWARGRREDALELMGECVEIRRELAAEHPERFLGPLTAALDTRASRLAEQGHADEASADPAGPTRPTESTEPAKTAKPIKRLEQYGTDGATELTKIADGIRDGDGR
jgi:hypothetical protein